MTKIFVKEYKIYLDNKIKYNMRWKDRYVWKNKSNGNQDEINGVEILEASKIMNALGGRGNT